MNTAPKPIHYVVGFMFNPTHESVLLIHKQRPAHLKGKWNGPGGKVEENESPAQAMVREFREETGMDTVEAEWRHYCNLFGKERDESKFHIDLFTTVGPIQHAKNMTDEQVQGFFVEELTGPLTRNILPQLLWLIPMALQRLQYGAPRFTIVNHNGIT